MAKKYKTKTIPLNGDRRLIYRVKKAGIQTLHPRGDWNGYGYTQLPLVAVINSLSEMRKFNKIKRELELEPPTRKLSEEEKKMKWAKRLMRLVGDEYDLTLEKALDIADEKIAYKEQQIERLEDRQFERGYSEKREKYIKKIERSNPLRRIDSVQHARAIMGAHHRHKDTDYDKLLAAAHKLEDEGLLERGDAKRYVLNMDNWDYDDYEYFDF